MLEASSRRVQVGLFAYNASRRPVASGRIDHNPTLGAQHEFGLANCPRRSFLEMPLSLYLGAAIFRIRHELGDALTEPKSGPGPSEFMSRLATAAKDLVDQAFATGGFGHWPPLSPVTIFLKGHATILRETDQMRDAIATRIV